MSAHSRTFLSLHVCTSQADSLMVLSASSHLVPPSEARGLAIAPQPHHFSTSSKEPTRGQNFLTMSSFTECSTEGDKEEAYVPATRTIVGGHWRPHQSHYWALSWAFNSCPTASLHLAEASLPLLPSLSLSTLFEALG